MKVTIELEGNVYVAESDSKEDLLDFVENMLGVSKKPYMYPPVNPYYPTSPYPGIPNSATPMTCKHYTTTSKTFPLEVKSSNVKCPHLWWGINSTGFDTIAFVDKSIMLDNMFE